MITRKTPKDNDKQSNKPKRRKAGCAFTELPTSCLFSFAGRESHLQTGYNYVPESNVWWKIRQKETNKPEKKVAVNIFKSQICFSGRPTFGERKTLPYQPRSLLYLFPFIARAFKVLAVRSSVFLVVFASCYENGTPERFNRNLRMCRLT